MAVRPREVAPGAHGDHLVASLLDKTTFPAPGAEVSCAVSGGADSLALLVLATAAGCSVTAFHVDHGLRGGGDAEAEAVAEAARALGARFVSRRVVVGAGANLEARARAARFSVLPEEVATGHTMDDQAETVLANLLRGAGGDGMAGMRPGLRHPLLELRRHETKALCEARGLSWLDDPMNSDPAFLRNRIRHHLLPLLCELAGRDVVPVLARQAEVFADEADFLDQLSIEAVPDPKDTRRLAGAPDPLARRAVRRLLGALSDRDAPPGRAGAHHRPSLAEVSRVLAVARGQRRATEISGGPSLRRSGGRLVVGELRSAKAADRPDH